jgi:hypothetical protein
MSGLMKMSVQLLPSYSMRTDRRDEANIAVRNVSNVPTNLNIETSNFGVNRFLFGCNLVSYVKGRTCAEDVLGTEQENRALGRVAK